MEDVYLTTKELSKTLKITRQTINSYMRQGMPHHKFGPSKTSPVRFKLSEVQEWFNNKK